MALHANVAQAYRDLGGPDGYLGGPTTDTYAYGSGSYTWFQGGVLIWDQQSNAIQHYAGRMGLAGQPGWGTQLDYRVSDTVDAKVDVGTGNLNVSVTGLTVPGIGGDKTIGLTYNSFAANDQGADGISPLLGQSFRLTDAPDTKLVADPDKSVRYLDPSGRDVLYRWTGSAYEAPVGDGGTKLERDASNNWVLTTLASNRKQTFRASDGLEISDADRNGNAYSFSYNSNGVPTSITGTRGGAPITLTAATGVAYGRGSLQSMQQTIDGVTRTMSFGYDSTGKLSSVTDASGGVTSFAWTGNDLTQITDPRGIATAFQYDDNDEVLQVVRDYGG